MMRASRAHMSKESFRNSVRLAVNPRETGPQQPLEDDAPFRILILGNFSGRTSGRTTTASSEKRLRLVDRDNIDDVVHAFQPTIQVQGVTMSFANLDDFHPDAIYGKLDVFRQLAGVRAN